MIYFPHFNDHAVHYTYDFVILSPMTRSPLQRSLGICDGLLALVTWLDYNQIERATQRICNDLTKRARAEMDGISKTCIAAATFNALDGKITECKIDLVAAIS